MQAYNTFFHQGTDLTCDLDSLLKRLGEDVLRMRNDMTRLEKTMEERHSAGAAAAVLPQPPSGDAAPMQGYLFKRTSNAFKTWHRRWFILQDHQLVYKKRTGKCLPSNIAISLEPFHWVQLFLELDSA